MDPLSPQEQQSQRLRKFITFMLLMYVTYFILMPRLFPRPEPPDPAKAPDVVVKAQEDAPPAEAAPVAPVVTAPERWFTLGSADPASGYRMLVTLTSRGAAIERIELNHPRYLDSVHREVEAGEDKSGWIGPLGETNHSEGGCLVQVVGPATPAAAAGMQPGDILKSVDGEPIANVASWRIQLRKTRPRQTLSLGIERGGEPLTLSATLAARPIRVVQQEADDPLSYLLTIDSLNGKTLLASEAELPGLSLRRAHWQAATDEAGVSFTYPLGNGLEVVKRYELPRVPNESQAHRDFRAYHVALKVELRNTGTTEHNVAYRLDGPTGLPREGWWYAHKISRQFFGAVGIRDVVASFRQGVYLRPDLKSCDVVADQSHELLSTEIPDAPVIYAGVDALYFAAAMLPVQEDPQERRFSETSAIRVGAVPEDRSLKKLTNVSCRLVSKVVSLAPGKSMSHDYQLFAGPKRPSLLAEYGLGDLIEYGWFGFTAVPLLTLMHFFHDWIFGNYGLSIIMLTVLVRSCMFPITRKQTLNAQKMQELQPELQRIRERYKSQPEEMVKQQQELFRKHKFNPAAGCLPMFLQLPIFIGLYRSLALDVELRQSSLFPGLEWASNLCMPDMLWYWEPVMPAMLASPQGWFGPYLNLLPLLTTGLFLLQQKLLMPPPTDEQSRVTAKMMWYMTIFMGLMFFKVACGLCIYFIASSLWSLAERKLLPKPVPKASSAVIDVKSEPVGNGKSKKKNRDRR